MADSSRSKEFYITVQFRRRLHHYKVVHHRLNKEEQFSIVTEQRTVVIKAKQGLKQTGKGTKRTYSYEEEEITNKTLMNKIIEEIERHLNS